MSEELERIIGSTLCRKCNERAPKGKDGKNICPICGKEVKPQLSQGYGSEIKRRK